MGMIDLAPGTRVIAALSGGVDSSVAMALAKEQGLDVIGVILQLWDYTEPQKFGTCCASRDIADARSVCDILNVPFYVIDSNKIFKEKVVDYFKEEYEQGRTPSPCVLCNSKVKFQIIHEIAKDMKAEAIITGHYTRTIFNPISKNIEIFRADDKVKDQSYFMFGLEQNIMNMLRTPLGEYTKDEVRQFAERLKLTKVAGKKDSQDLCFLGSLTPQEFIQKNYNKKFEKANVVNIETGEVIGEHSGIIDATVGQRKGFGISSEKKLYVVKIDRLKNQIFMGEEKDLMGDVMNVNWIKMPKEEKDYIVKIRYRHEGARARVFKDGRVCFYEPQKAISPGQAAVCYDENEQLVAGGFINS